MPSENAPGVGLLHHGEPGGGTAAGCVLAGYAPRASSPHSHPPREPVPLVRLVQALLHLVNDRAYYKDYIYEGSRHRRWLQRTRRGHALLFLQRSEVDASPQPMPAVRPSKEAVLGGRIGDWQIDPYLEQELEEIHKRRGRSMGRATNESSSTPTHCRFCLPTTEAWLSAVTLATRNERDFQEIVGLKVVNWAK